MACGLRHPRNDQCAYVDPGALEVPDDRFRIRRTIHRNAIVADQRVREDKDLALIRRVGHGFGITDHAGIEDDFPCRRNRRTEGFSFAAVPICQNEFCFHSLFPRRRQPLGPPGHMIAWFSDEQPTTGILRTACR